jgi:hypothetical protein
MKNNVLYWGCFDWIEFNWLDYSLLSTEGLCPDLYMLLRVTIDLILLHLSGNWSPIYTPNVSRLARKNLPYMEKFFLTRKNFSWEFFPVSPMNNTKWYSLSLTIHNSVRSCPTDHASTVRTNNIHISLVVKRKFCKISAKTLCKTFRCGDLYHLVI